MNYEEIKTLAIECDFHLLDGTLFRTTTAQRKILRKLSDSEKQVALFFTADIYPAALVDSILQVNTANQVVANSILPTITASTGWLLRSDRAFRVTPSTTPATIRRFFQMTPTRICQICEDEDAPKSCPKCGYEYGMNCRNKMLNDAFTQYALGHPNAGLRCPGCRHGLMVFKHVSEVGRFR
jgi:hypothetical protein